MQKRIFRKAGSREIFDAKVSNQLLCIWSAPQSQWFIPWLKSHDHFEQSSADVTDSQQLMQRAYGHDDGWLGLLYTLHTSVQGLSMTLCWGIRLQKLGAFQFSFWKAHQLGRI